MEHRRALPGFTTLARILITRALPFDRQRTLPTLIWMQRVQRMELGQKLVRNQQVRGLVWQDEAGMIGTIFLAEQQLPHPFLVCC